MKGKRNKRSEVQTTRHQPAGFTLIEVVVALVIAAILASGLLALQRYGLSQAREAEILWGHLHTAQEALLGQVLARPDTRSDSQAISTDQIVVPPPAPERPTPWATLTTRRDGRELHWSWPMAGD